MSPDDEAEARGPAYEDQHVHQVYEQIASHFSQTRYKPWPIVTAFLSSLPPGSVGLDVGCGNGKYLPLNPAIYIVASDRSPSLAAIAAQHQPHSAIVADTMALPHKSGSFDFAICIAVLHHLSTGARRREALGRVLEVLRAGKDGSGRALVYVWALEQEGSRRGWREGGEQDVMVPWVLNKNAGKKKGGKGEEGGEKKEEEAKTYQRYYHLYRKGELEEDIMNAGGVVLESGYEKDNWWAIAARRPE